MLFFFCASHAMCHVLFLICASPHGVPAGYVCGLLCDVMFLATTVDTCDAVSTVCVGHCIAPSYAVCGMWAVFSSTCLAFSAAFLCVVCAVVRRPHQERKEPATSTARYSSLRIINHVSLFSWVR